MKTSALLLAASLTVALHAAPEQKAGDDPLKRPIIESGLPKQTEVEVRQAIPLAAATAPKSLPFPEAVPDAVEQPSRKEKGPTEITAFEATFDNKTHQAVFTHQVVVNDPEFNVTCDKLVAYLRHDEDATEPAAPARKPADAKAAPPPRKGGLERATAIGNVVISQDKFDEKGNATPNIGRGKIVEYDAQTGRIVLRGKPVVKQGMNMCVATAEDTVITLTRDRNMEVVGAHRTVIVDKGDLETK